MFQGPVSLGKKLPRVRPLGTGGAILCGYPGKKHCFSARLIGGQVDVALYVDCYPKEVAENAAFRAANAYYTQMPEIPGWGYQAIAELRQQIEGITSR